MNSDGYCRGYVSFAHFCYISNDGPRMTLTNFMARLPRSGLYMGKSESSGYFGNYYSLRPESWQKQTSNECMRFIKVKVIS